jgi:hypothetical protein
VDWMIWFAKASCSTLPFPTLLPGGSRRPTHAQLRGWSPFVGLPIEYSLIERTVERELVPMAKALNLGLIELGFPQDLYAKEMVRIIRYGGLRDKILA